MSHYMYDASGDSDNSYSGDVSDSLLEQDSEYEVDQYYVHPDHLGSASFITDLNGETYQHVEYLPFGEVFAEERNTEQDRFVYLYNGKELDEMTGLYYYGARYYDPRDNIFLGCDPLAEARPWFSPYNYCQNNPVMRIDPTGALDWEPNGNGTWTAEQGDGAETLAKDAGISKATAYQLMEEQGYGTYVDKNDGITKSAIDPGEVVDVNSQEVSQMKEVSSNENTIQAQAGDAWQEGMPTVFHTDDNILIVSKKTNTYMDINDRKLLGEYISNRKAISREKGVFYMPRADPLVNQISGTTHGLLFGAAHWLGNPVPGLPDGDLYKDVAHKKACSNMYYSYDLYLKFNTIYE